MGEGNGPPQVRRVGVIGDIHTEVLALERVLTHLQTLGLDRLLATGDVVDGPGPVDAVDRICLLLEEASVITVSGNHDRWLQDGEMRKLADATDAVDVSAESLAFLAALPTSIDFETPLGRTLLCHGLGDDDMAGVQPHDHGRELSDNEELKALLKSGYDFVINGHTHRRMVRPIQTLTIINAGTLLRTQQQGFLTIDFELRRVTFFDLSEAGNISESKQHEI